MAEPKVKRKPRKRSNRYSAKEVRNDSILFGAFDVETQGLGGKLLMVQWGIMDEVFYDSSELMLDKFFEHLLKWPLPAIHYGHFAQYDWRYMMDWLAESGLEIDIGMRTESDVYEIRIKNADGETCVMRDSYAIWSHPLKSFADTFTPELPKLDIDIANFNPTDPAHIEYGLRDIWILMRGLPRLARLLDERFSVTMNATAASTALKAWQQTIPEGVTYFAADYGDGVNEKFIRDAYYGGLVFLTDTKRVQGAVTIDNNSAYPAMMHKYGVPYGIPAHSVNYHTDKMGIYSVRVKAPDDLRVAILPARDAKGNMRWYKGEFNTTCTNRELIFAAQNGYEILEVYDGLVFSDVIFPFEDFIEKCKAIRKEFKGTASELLAKLMQNSLYGKFGSRRERTKVFLGSCTAENDPVWQGATPLCKDSEWFSVKELDEGMKCNPAWAVFITAHARLNLLQAVYSAGVENVLYGDTDSITFVAGPHLENVDIGPDYGQWKIEKEWQEFRAIAPKVYSGILKDGRFVGAAKGMPRKNLTERHWRELLETGESSAEALSLASLRLTMKRGVEPAISLTRKSSNLNNSSNFILLPDGTVSLKMAA